MNLLHLEYFYTVAKEGSFTKASKVLRIQQPAISRMVKQLEESFGFALFEKIGRGVRLTPQGIDIFEQSKLIFAQVKDLEQTVGELEGVPKGPLSFAAAEPIASHFVPEVLEKLIPKFPKLYPLLYSGPASMLLDRIANGDLEFGLFFHLPKMPLTLKVTTLRKVRFYLVVRKDLRKKVSILESFIGSREIDDTATRTFPMLEKLKKNYPQASIKISSNNLTAHRSLVLSGLGVAILPDFLVSKDLREGTLVDILQNENFEFNLKLVQRVTSVLSLNATSFLNCCGRE